VCVYVFVFCIFITFYFRSLVSFGLWVPLFVFVFLYFVSRSSFILDLLCLVDCGFPMCVFKFLYFVSLSPFILDLLCLVDCGFLCLCLYSCILYLYHLLFQISCVLWNVSSSVCVYIHVFCI
jgi:hypothetical protein